MLSRADLESARFGLNVARGTLDAVDAAALARELIEGIGSIWRSSDPARPNSGIAALAALGFSPIHAEYAGHVFVRSGRYSRSLRSTRRSTFVRRPATTRRASPRSSRPCSPNTRITTAPTRSSPGKTSSQGMAVGAQPHRRERTDLLGRLHGRSHRWPGLQRIRSPDGRLPGRAARRSAGVRAQPDLHRPDPLHAAHLSGTGAVHPRDSTQVGNLRVQRFWVKRASASKARSTRIT